MRALDMMPILAAGFHFQGEMECPTCEKPIPYTKYHRKCLAERHGGTIPDDIERLIVAFQLEDAQDGSRNNC